MGSKLAPTMCQASAVSVSCSPRRLYETDHVGSPFCTRVRSLDQVAPGHSPTARTKPRGGSILGSVPHCASPQVQNVHGAFNALGGADRLTSNRMYPIPTLRTAFCPKIPSAAGREPGGEGGNVYQALAVSQAVNASFPQLACEEVELSPSHREGKKSDLSWQS